MIKKYSKNLIVLFLAVIISSVVCFTGCGNTSDADVSENGGENVSGSDIAAELRDPQWYTRMDGSTACIPLANLIVRRMTGCDQVTAAEVLEFNTTNYVTAVLEGNAEQYEIYRNNVKDIALVYESADLLSNKALEYHDIGSDGLVFLVNADNPVDSITLEQARDIYSGKITNWKELGGYDQPIIAYHRDVDSGSGVMMEKLVMNGVPYKDFPEELILDSMSELVSDVADYNNNGNAIGYSVYYYIKNMYGSPDIKLLKIDGVEPTIETISSKEYMLTNDFYVVIRKNSGNNSAERILMNWILSDEGKQTVIDAGYAAK